MPDEERSPEEEPLECRSPEGITVGLVDSLIYILRVLATRDLSTHHVQEALEDLQDDPDLRTVLEAGPLTWVSQKGAHALAERQRAQRASWERPVFNGNYAALNAVDELIDLIDPEVE